MRTWKLFRLSFLALEDHMTVTTPELLSVYNNIAEFPSLKQVAKQLGVSKKTVQNRIGALRAAGHEGIISRVKDASVGRLGFDPVLPGFHVTRAAVEEDAEGEVQRRWIETRRAPGDKFEIPKGHVIKGVSAFVDKDKNVLAEWIKTREDTTGNLVEALQDAFKEYRGGARIEPAPQYVNADLLTVYPLADLHLGMHSWGRETGESYDLKIAVKRARQMMSYLIGQSQPSKEALILDLGDLFHMNDQKNMTPRSGHILDVDGRWPKVLAAGVRLMMDMIEMALQRHEIVRFRALPGNHDPDAAIALTVALSVFYEDHPRVIIDDNPSLIFYHRFGKVLLGASHGHTMKPDRMAMAMASDCPEDWGMTIWKAFFFGHIHHESAKEIGPVRVESFNTIAAKDAHAHGGGYRSGQALTAITYHRELGEIGRHRTNLLH
jgi:hypothetical protein